ncbi:TonB-dependent receptor [Vibrio sp.]|nr:TonB-dependent receptor [Vibrio sp.]
MISSQKTGLKLSQEQYDIIGWDDTWVAGIDLLNDETVQSLDNTDLHVTPDMEYQSISPFIQGDFEVTERLRLSAGVRHEDISINVDDTTTLYGYGSNDVIGGTNDYSETVFNIGSIYQFTEKVSGFVSFNQGFGLPDYGRVLRGTWGDDPSVNTPIDFNSMSEAKPVVTDNYEMGFNFRGDKLTLGATTYISIAEDGANLVLNGDNYEVERQKTEIWGYELTSTYQLFDSTMLHVLYSHIEGEVDTNGDNSVDSKMDLRNTSPDRLMLAANHSFSETIKGRIQYNHLFDESKEENDVGSAQSFDGYGLFDLSTQFDFKEKGRIALGIENVFDEQYINYFSQVRQSDAYYFSGRGRTMSVNYEVDF